MRRWCGLMAIAACGLAAGAVAPRRTFPNTRDRIRVFADMLPTQMSPAQWRFASTHYAGTQKQTVSWIRRMRTLNPGFLMLHYQLAVGTGPALFVEGDRWVNDFPAVSTHTDWFMRDAKGARIHQGRWDWYVMDIRFDGDRPRTGFPAYWTGAAIRRMRENEADGCFADSYTQDILMRQVQPAIPPFADPASCRRDWLPGLNRYGQWCAEAFHRAPERFVFLPNLGGQVTTWDRVTNILVGDGGMIEGFASPAPGSYLSEDDWRLQMTRVLSLSRAGKIVLCQTAVDPADQDHRWFVAGSHLLTKGPRSYLSLIHKSSLEWYPEYGLDLGPYLADPPADVVRLWDPAWNVFRRDFQKGVVLVNSGAQPVEIAGLGSGYRLVTATGGGAVPDDGAEPGRLDARPVEVVMVPARSARVLLRP